MIEIYVMKTESCYDAKFALTECPTSCHNDNLLWHATNVDNVGTMKIPRFQ